MNTPFLNDGEEKKRRTTMRDQQQRNRSDELEYDALGELQQDYSSSKIHFAKKQQSSQKQQKGTMRDFIKENTKVFFTALIVVIIVRVFIFQPFRVDGESMLPNFEHRDYLFAFEFGYKTTHVGLLGKTFFSVTPWKNLERSEIIVFRSPGNRKVFFIKRVIGLPGETVEVRDGRVFITPAKSTATQEPTSYVLDESAYLSQHIITIPATKRTLGDDEYFVMGDNRGNSTDSRMWGALKRDAIIGPVSMRALPLDNITIF